MKVYVIGTSPEIGAISNNLFYIDKDEADGICAEMNVVYKDITGNEETPWSVYEADLSIKESGEGKEKWVLMVGRQ